LSIFYFFLLLIPIIRNSTNIIAMTIYIEKYMPKAKLKAQIIMAITEDNSGLLTFILRCLSLTFSRIKSCLRQLIHHSILSPIKNPLTALPMPPATLFPNRREDNTGAGDGLAHTLTPSAHFTSTPTRKDSPATPRLIPAISAKRLLKS